MKRIASTLLVGFGTLMFTDARLVDVAPKMSPDLKHLASVEILPAKNFGQDVVESTLPNAKVAVVILQDASNKKILHSIPIPDADDTDNRNSVGLSWSPVGRILEVRVQIGKLTGYTLYRIVSDKLVEIEELPIPNKLVIKPEHQRSRGGASIVKWTGNDTFVAVDTIASAEYTYHITKKWKAEVIASRPKEEAEQGVAPNDR
jgi:hypothetical protein